MFGNHDVGDVENVKHEKGTGISGLRAAGREGAKGVTTIVRTGNRALDLALASDRSARADLRTLRAGCRRATAPRFIAVDAPAPAVGAVADTMSLTRDRDGAGSTLHAGSTHTLVDGTGRARTIRVWHELATHGCN